MSGINRLKFKDKSTNTWVPFSADDTLTLGGKTADVFEQDLYSLLAQQLASDVQDIKNTLSGGLTEQIQAVESQLPLKRDKEVKITSADLDISTDVNKVKLINLSDEVKQAITGNAPVLSVIGEKAVTVENIGFFDFGRRNLYNKLAITNGFYVDNVTGNLLANVDYITSDFMRVNASEQFWSTNNMNIAFYDINKVFVAGLGGGWGTPTYTGFSLTVPNNINIKYVRMTVPKVNESIFMFVNGTDEPQSYMPYGEYDITITSEPFSKAIKSLASQSGNRLTPLKWNALGTSITFGLNADGYPYHKWISDRTGIYVRNYGIPTSTIAEIGDPSVYNPMCLRYANMDIDADVITVEGGTNDITHGVELGVMSDRVTTTFYGALHVLLSGLINKYPTKSIGYMLPPFALPNSDLSDRMNTFNKAIRDVCMYYGIPVLDIYSGNQLCGVVPARKNLLIPDGLHPSKLGHEKLSFAIEQFLQSI